MNLHTPQLNIVIERRFSVIKEGALAMLLNAKLNDIAQKMLWKEAVHTCERIRNSMANTGSTTSPFESFIGENPKITGSFSEFGRIIYVTKRDKFKKKMTDKCFNAIMVGYTDNNTRDTYKLYNTETKRVIMNRDVKWANWKNTDPAENLKMFCEAEKEDLVPGIEEDIFTSNPEENMPLHLIPEEGEIVRPNENSEKSSELTYLKKYADTSAYDRVFNALKKLDTLYNPMMQKMHDLVIEGNYKVTGDTRFITIVEHEDDKIQWACSTSIYTDAGEPETLKEAMTRPNGHL